MRTIKLSGKYAICLHGKFNGTTSRISGINGYKFINSTILNKYPIDVFCHSWDTYEREHIISLYKPKKHCIIPQKSFAEEIVENKLELECKNNLSYYYGRLMSVNLKSEYEREHDFIYDSVLLCRYDMGETSACKFYPHIDMNSIYCKWWNQLNNGLDEHWFYSSSKNINKLSTLYYSALEYFKLGSNYRIACENWPDSNSDTEFSNEIEKLPEDRSKKLDYIADKNLINNHLIYKYFCIDHKIYDKLKFIVS